MLSLPPTGWSNDKRRIQICPPGGIGGMEILFVIQIWPQGGRGCVGVSLVNCNQSLHLLSHVTSNDMPMHGPLLGIHLNLFCLLCIPVSFRLQVGEVCAHE